MESEDDVHRPEMDSADDERDNESADEDGTEGEPLGPFASGLVLNPSCDIPITVFFFFFFFF